MLCALQPYQDLHENNASATKSTKASYTTVPPPLAIWRALRAKHFLLALVCASTLSINALAVAFGGLINESTETTRQPAEVKELFTSQVNDNRQYYRMSLSGAPQLRDHFYRFLANSSGEAALPNWVDSKYYYLPFEIPLQDVLARLDKRSTVVGYSGITHGLRVDLSCNEGFTNGTDSQHRLNFEMTEENKLNFDFE